MKFPACALFKLKSLIIPHFQYIIPLGPTKKARPVKTY